MENISGNILLFERGSFKNIGQARKNDKTYYKQIKIFF